MKQAYEADKKNWLATEHMRLAKKNWLAKEKFSEETPGLFQPEFLDTRGMSLTAKCYLVKMRPMKINIAAKVFQRSIMICIFTPIKMSWMFV